MTLNRGSLVILIALGERPDSSDDLLRGFDAADRRLRPPADMDRCCRERLLQITEEPPRS